MNRGRQIFVTSLLLSLAVHLLVAGNTPDWWSAPAQEIPFPIEAHLALPKPPALAEGASAPSSASNLPKPVRLAPAPVSQPFPQPISQPPISQPEAPPQVDASVSVPAPEPGPAVAPEPAPQTESAPRVAEAPVAPPDPQAEAKPRREQRPLPKRLVLVYSVQAGDGGFNLGQATYTWQVQGERYSLSSMAEATGMASLFMSGRIEQSSEGRIGPAGLLPEQFSMTRNQKRQDVARFDWPGKRLFLAKGEELLRDNTQDMLSFPFHLAMTVAEGDGGWIVPVTNGRKLKGYRFTILGRESVEVGRERLEALHVQGTRALDGSLDVWLAPSRHWLPVRIRTEDLKGKVMELTLARLEG